MAQKIKKISKKLIALVCMFTLVFSASVTMDKSNAAALTILKDTLSDSRASESYVKHTVTFRVTGAVPVSGKIVLDFPTGFNTTGINAADMTLNSDNTATPTTAYSLIDGAADAANCNVANTDADGGVITITLCSTGSGTCNMIIDDYVLITIGDGLEGSLVDIPNPVAGAYNIDIDTQDAVSAEIDTGSVSVAVITSGVAVSATIDSYIDFSSTDYDVGFGSWSASTAKRWATSNPLTGATSEGVAPFVLEVSTNATGGASISVRSLNAALNSTSDSITAAGATAIAGGAEGYGLYFSAETGTLDRGDAWDDTATGVLTTDAQVVAVSTANVLSSATIDGQLVAAIADTTEAGSYSDTLIFVATATY